MWGESAIPRRACRGGCCNKAIVRQEPTHTHTVDCGVLPGCRLATGRNVEQRSVCGAWYKRSAGPPRAAGRRPYAIWGLGRSGLGSEPMGSTARLRRPPPKYGTKTSKDTHLAENPRLRSASAGRYVMFDLHFNRILSNAGAVYILMGDLSVSEACVFGSVQLRYKAPRRPSLDTRSTSGRC